MKKPTKALAAYVDVLDACYATGHTADDPSWRADLKTAAAALYAEGEKHTNSILGRWALDALADHYAPWHACGEKQDANFVDLWVLYGVFVADKDGIAVAREQIADRIEELFEIAPDSSDRREVLDGLAFLMSRYDCVGHMHMKAALEALAAGDCADCSPEVLSFIPASERARRAGKPLTGLPFKPLRA